MTFRFIKFYLLVFSSALLLALLTGCQDDPIDGMEEEDIVWPCQENIEGDCSHLSKHSVMSFLSANSCDAYCIMKNFVEDCPAETYINGEILDTEEYLDFFYTDESLNLDSVIATNVLVHEAMHHLIVSEIPFSDNSFFILNCDQTWIVTETSTFPCNELIDVIDENNRTPRWDGYIASGPTQSTQTRGIYGLMGEFNSYYQGGKAILDLAKNKNETDNIIYVLNAIVPYYEFKFWILNYLLFAEENYPSVFLGIMNNENFKESFLAIEIAFADVVEELSVDIDPLNSAASKTVKNVAEKMTTIPFSEMMERLSE